MKPILICVLLVLAAAPRAGAQAPRRGTSAGRADAVRHVGRAKEVPGPELYKAPPLTPEARVEMEKRLAEARARYERSPRDPEAIIWLGRRTAYLGRFDEAIAVYTEGVGRHPRDARLYRHRGHRYITTRRFDEAVKDLTRAARLIKGRPDETEPDGIPNARNTPTSTLNSNVWYHLGLAHYLRGDFRAALAAYRECLKFSKNPDMLAATTHWLYMTLRRLRRDAEARSLLAGISEGMDVIENRDYHRLLLMYQGKLGAESLLREASGSAGSPGSSATAYGVGNWYLYTGQPERALRTFLEIVGTDQRTSFGYIAAEAELRRVGLLDYWRRGLPRRNIH